MEKLRKRYKFIANVEAVAVSLLIILGMAAVIASVFFRHNKQNVILIVLAAILFIILALIDLAEKKILKEFFLQGCQSGKNLYSGGKKIRMLTVENELSKSIIGIFFEEKNNKHAIYVVYKTENVKKIPCYIEEIKEDKEHGCKLLIDRIPVPDLDDLEYYLSIA